MPIEIRELVIKATVAEQGTQTNTGTDRANNAVGTSEEVIRICVERILEILQDKTER